MGRKKGSVGKNRSVPADELRDVLKPVFAKLEKAGVPRERLPRNDAIVSKLLEWIDDKKVDDWIAMYAKAMK